MDEFKKYLQQHREDLDADEPRPLVWQKVQQQIQPPKQTARIVSFAWVRYAVAACVLVLAGIGVWYLAKPAAEVTTAKVELQKQEPVIQTNPPTITTPEKKLAEETKTVMASNNTPSILPKSKQVVSNKTNTQTENIDVVLNNLQSSFAQMISMQKNKINSTPIYAEGADYFNDFKIQMNQMDADEKQVRKDIKTNGMKEEMVGQLINIYQKKLDLLKQLQLEMTKLNNRFKQNRGPIDTTKTYFINI